ncbi:hypothetical protein HanIR_Chr05g0216661 [Helianthus annuus]|nr:hypothetical protein HanIR_Chr05g0216661 [Helianthus annuus]
MEPNSGLGLKNLFNEEDFVEDTPPHIGSGVDNNEFMENNSSDPFNIMDLLNQMAQQKKRIDLNNVPCSSHQSDNVGRCEVQVPLPHQKTGQKKNQHNFPSLKMKDTLWNGRNTESSRNRSKSMISSGESSSGGEELMGCANEEEGNTDIINRKISQEVAATVRVGENVGFRVSGYEERVKNQIVEAQATNNAQ